MIEPRTPTAIDAKIGAKLRACRIEQGVTQEALAAKLGITFQQVQKYETGTNRIAASRLFDIASVLKQPIRRFLPDPKGVS